jgi:epoxyqueuosine reductase QueG
MARLTKDLRDYARELQLDFIGFGSSGTLTGGPRDTRPTRYLASVKSIISIGYRLNYAALQNLPASRSTYMLEHDYANRHLDGASHAIARFLEERGFATIGFDAGAGFYHEAGKPPHRFAGDISHKHAAVACGLGKFGLNNLVLSRQWGPRIRLATIVTAAELEYDHVFKGNPCPTHECEACVKVCPVGALDGWRGEYDPDRGWVMDKKRCYDYIFTTLKGQRCGLCIKACPIGLEALPGQQPQSGGAE